MWAHSPTTLYLVNVSTFRLDAAWTFVFYDTNGTVMSSQEMVDIAVNVTGEMYGVSWDPAQSGGYHLYGVDIPTVIGTGAAFAHRIAELPAFYNGLTFAPAGMVTAGEALLGADNDANMTTSNVDIIDIANGQTTALGSLGSVFKSSGDLVAIENVGLFATVKNEEGTVFLAELNTATGRATLVGSGIGYDKVWGLAYWSQQFIGFNADGLVITVDAATGEGSLLFDYDVSLLGAAVRPAAD
jgi:hypothetical protein